MSGVAAQQEWTVEENEDEVEDLDPVLPAQGFWEGDSFRLEQFPAEPAAWDEGDVEVVQTMGTLDLLYYLQEDESHLDEDSIEVQVGAWKTKVTCKGAGGQRSEISPLTGNLYSAVWPKFSVWRLLREGGQACIHLHLAKLDHRAWRGLWATGFDPAAQAKKHSFAWVPKQREGPSPYRNKEMYTVPHETPPPPVESDYRLDALALCLGRDDVEEFESHYILRLHFSRPELERLEGVMPLEDVLTADVRERHLRVFLRVSGEDGQRQLDVFAGELAGRCVPELTSWQVVRAAKGDPKGKGEAFNPALEITFVKHPDDQAGRWGRLFSQRSHAEELAAESMAAKDKDYRRCEAQLRARCDELLHPSDGAPPQVEGQMLVLGSGGEEELCTPARREFLVDNSDLRAPTHGLGYRRSRHLQDKDGEELAAWGSTVLGIDMGDWVQVGQRYLPKRLNGRVVLTGDVIGLPRSGKADNIN